MISSTTLQTIVNGYWKSCRDNHCKPTYGGLAELLGISSGTVANVVRGLFNGHAYTVHPHINRCIDNGDFDLIRAIFKDSAGANLYGYGNI